MQFVHVTIQDSYYLYDLCDEYGMYVIDETDLECHGFELTGNYAWISDDPTWETCICISYGTYD